MEKKLKQESHELQNLSSDIEKKSIYSSENESINYNTTIKGVMRTEFLDDLDFNENEGGKSIPIDRIKKSLKTAKSLRFSDDIDLGSSGAKKIQIFKCSQCPKVFSNSSAIAKHKLTHSDERKYVCEICNKAFKRQDHLNGHKHTHKANKPHACHLCDRSYSDARSLRRHYENQHQGEFLRCKEQIGNRDSAGSSVDESTSVEVFGFWDVAKSIKCDVCNKGFRNQSALNGHMRLHGGYGQTNNSITGPGEARYLAWDDGQSISSNVVAVDEASLSQPQSLLEKTQPAVPSDSITPSKSIGDLDLNIQANASSAAVNSRNLSDISMDDVYVCLPKTSNNTNTSPCQLTETSTSLLSSAFSQKIYMNNCETNYSPVTPALTTSSKKFTYPTVVDASFGNTNQQEYPYDWSDKHNQWSYYDTHDGKSPATSSLPLISSSSNLQDLLMNLDSIDPCSNLESEWCKFSDGGNEDVNNTMESSETESLVKKEVVEPVKVSHNRTNPQPSIETKPVMVQEQPLSTQYKRNKTRPAPIFIPPQTSAHWSRLRSPCVWNAADGREVKIPPYTPPPMLSPQRKGSGLFNSVWHCNNGPSSNLYLYTNCLSNNTIAAMLSCSNNNSAVSCSNPETMQLNSVIPYIPIEEKRYPTVNVESPVLGQLENTITFLKKKGEPEHFLYQDECLECHPQTTEDSDGLPTSATPRINIGQQYQAKLPRYHKVFTGKYVDDKRVWDELLWDPMQFKDTLENSSSLDLLMKIASSPAVKSCGLNMEYTFHLLCKFKGDFEKTLQTLLEDSFVVYDYVYAETTTWTTEEINKFQERLKKHDRDFMRVALDLQSYGMNKSVKACVEFYYVWKQMNNIKDIKRFRSKSIRKKRIIVNSHTVGNASNGTISTMGPGYNLRRRQTSGNLKIHMPYHLTEYKTSSESSSREASPSYCKSRRNILKTNVEKVKKTYSYHCSLCKRKFAKSKTLENHLQSHENSNLSTRTFPSM